MKLILARRELYSTPFFKLIGKTLDGEQMPYYCLELPDYLCVVPRTRRGEIILVRQYRPAIERSVIEFPAGHVEPGEDPETAATRELAEETGFTCERMELLGPLRPDTGRLSNRQWCFFAHAARPGAGKFHPEDGLECLVYSSERFRALLASGEFDHALHLAALTLAVSKGRLPSNYLERIS